MSILPFLRSLLLTSVFSFVAPIVLVGGDQFVLNRLYSLEGKSIAEQILQFLATFGSGNSFRGLVVIGLTCSLVGVLFDTYAFYRYQSLRNH